MAAVEADNHNRWQKGGATQIRTKIVADDKEVFKEARTLRERWGLLANR